MSLHCILKKVKKFPLRHFVRKLHKKICETNQIKACFNVLSNTITQIDKVNMNNLKKVLADKGVPKLLNMK